MQRAVLRMCRDDVEHPGKSIAWGRWAITNNDPEFRGKGASDSGDDYGPAPGDHMSLRVNPIQCCDLPGQALCWGGTYMCCTILRLDSVEP